MRVCLGTSHVDRRVPFAIGTDVAVATTAALQDLVALLRARYEGAPPVEPRERCFGMRALREGTIERRIALAASGADPAIDGPFLEGFLAQGAGLALISTLRRVYSKSLDEEARLGGTEPVAWLTHVVLVAHLRAQKERLKNESIKGLGYEPLERCVGITLSAVLAAVLEEVLVAARRRPFTGTMARTEALLAAAVSPLSLVSIQQSVLRLAPNPWNLSKEVSDAIDTLGVHPLAAATTAGDCLEQVTARIAKSREIRALALDAGAMTDLRDATFRYLREFDVGREPLHEALASLVVGPHTLSQALSQVKPYEAAWHGAAALAAKTGGAQRQRIEELVSLFEHLAKKRAPRDEDDAIGNVAWSWLSYRRDRWAEECMEKARGLIVDRARDFAVPELRSQYDAGRVYRLAPDDQPILKEQTRKLEEGHLFLDLKGFTRLVAIAKEANVVEFLKKEFYVPILSSAKAYRAAGRRLELNNLLGDAVSFSGDVVSLVYLAEDVNQLFIDYEDRLRKRGLPASRIEAGLFIAYGTPPETIHVESEGWGDAAFSETVEIGTTRQQRIKVAIAEKINESARGTSRSGPVYSRIEALLDEDAKRRNGERREIPWAVFVDRVLQLTLPPSVMELCDRAIAVADPGFAGLAAKAVAEILESALVATDGSSSKMFGAVNDLYNVGRALSKEAVDAFVRDTGAMRFTIEKNLPVAELPPAFERFLFPEKTIKLIVSFDTGKARPKPIVFRFVGELQFRGFEGLRSTAIYEILDASSPVYTLLDRHFFEAWRAG